MESKFYVSREAARLLREIGYNEETDCVIDIEDGCIYTRRYLYENSFDFPEPEGLNLPCPSKAEAIDWLESKGIVVETFYNSNAEWVFYISTRKRIELYDSFDELVFPTRLEAENAAIIKALELLKIKHYELLV